MSPVPKSDWKFYGTIVGVFLGYLWLTDRINISFSTPEKDPFEYVAIKYSIELVGMEHDALQMKCTEAGLVMSYGKARDYLKRTVDEARAEILKAGTAYPADGGALIGRRMQAARKANDLVTTHIITCLRITPLEEYHVAPKKEHNL